MFQIGECVVSEQQLLGWMDRFVPEREPFYFCDDELANQLLAAGVLVYTNKEFFDNFPMFSINYGSMYKVWGVEKDARVICANSALLQRLEPVLRSRLYEQQVRLGRGHVHSEAWLRQCIVADEDMISVELQLGQSVTIGKERVFLLTRDRWESLHATVRQAWVLQWVSDGVLAETDGELVQWDPSRCPDPTLRDRITSVTGSFPDDSGPNCFASALSMVIDEEENGDEIRNRWLHAGPFFRVLTAQGYKKTTVLRCLDETGVIEASDILVWETAGGDAIHVALATGDGWVFNKMGQNWFQPWRMLPLRHVFGYQSAIAGGGRLAIYRKG